MRCCLAVTQRSIAGLRGVTGCGKEGLVVARIRLRGCEWKTRSLAPELAAAIEAARLRCRRSGYRTGFAEPRPSPLGTRPSSVCLLRGQRTLHLLCSSSSTELPPSRHGTACTVQAQRTRLPQLPPCLAQSFSRHVQGSRARAPIAQSRRGPRNHEVLVRLARPRDGRGP
jgi:hypothetical protein